MIKVFKLDGFNISLDFDEKRQFYTIYSYQRIVLKPQNKQQFSLPYKISLSLEPKYINFQVDRLLVEKGLDCIWNNLNEDSSEKSLIFLFKNCNIDFKDEQNNLNMVLGSNKKIDIIPNTILGKIFI